MRGPLRSLLVILLVAIGLVVIPATQADAAPPPAPSGVTASVDDLDIAVFWTPPDDTSALTGYEVTTDPAGPVLDLPVGADHAVLVGARPNTAYTVRVASQVGADESAPVPAASSVTVAAPGGSFQAVTPARLLDTRSGLGAPAGATTQVTLQVSGAGGVPATGASAVALNVTVTGPAGAGYVTAYPDGSSRPTASNLNVTKGQTVANLVVVPLGPDGRVVLFSSTPTQLIADAAGWFSAANQASPVAGLFHGLSPARLVDTRIELGGTTPQSAGSLAVQVTGVGGVPASGVSAVVLNTTVADPSGGGYVTVYPDGQPRPTASNLNFALGSVIANRVVVPVGAGGLVDFYTNGPTVPLIVDVTGWFTDGSDATVGGAYFAAVNPTRIVDTRIGLGAGKAPVPAATALAVAAAGHAGLPASSESVPATGMIANITAVRPTASGYFTAYPSLGARPTASDLNFRAGVIVPNLAIGRLGTDGDEMIYNSAGKTDVLVDVVGYFVGDVATPSTTHAAQPSEIVGVSGAAGGDQQITLASGAVAPPIGDVLTAGVTPQTPDGLLVRVTGITGGGGGQSIVSTEPASLSDAIGGAAFSISAPLSGDDVAAAGAGIRAITPDTLRARLAGAATTPVATPVNKVVTCMGGGEITVTGSVSVVLSINLSVDWSWLALRGAALTETLSEDAGLSAAAHAAASCSAGPIDLLPQPIRFDPIFFEIGPVPVVITPELQFTLSASGSVSADITASASQHASGTVGVAWQNGALVPIASTSSSFTYSPPAAGIKASVEVSVGADLSLFLYGVAGPYVTADAGVQLSADPSAVPAWKLIGTLDAGGGIAFPELDFDKSDSSILHYEHVIAQAPTPEHLYVVECLTNPCDDSSDVRIVQSNDTGGAQKMIGGSFQGGYGISVSPDGTRLVFEKTLSDGFLLFVRNVATGADQQLTFQDPACHLIENADTGPKWSPDGATIAYTHASLEIGGQCADVGVNTIPAGGGTPTRVPGSLMYQAAPAWNPSSTRWALTDGPTAYTTNTNGTGKQVFYSTTSSLLDGASWSRDGSTIAVSSLSASTFQYSLTGFTPQGGRLWSIAVGTGGDMDWSMDGSSLFYVTGNDSKVYRVAAKAGGAITSITYDHPVIAVAVGP